MSDIAIKFENISKQYRLGVVGTGTISHDMNRWWHLVRGKEDPYLQVGEVNDRSSKATSDYVWALRNITFDVKQGDVVGIIGKNGAGKSTLLKILSRVTSPTTGTIRARGRIASLLEVGTGFHPEMTGRENIYMNGSIMGMTKTEINRKFDEIVNFAGVEKYIDTPTKRYSSGMTVRLGFAIAAHLEPEILVVDEVLAVGDAEFQKKALGKMQDVSRGEGRTVLFVSHNLEAVRELCFTSVLMQNGTLASIGKTDDILREYKRGTSSKDQGIVSKRSEGFEFLGLEKEEKLKTLTLHDDIDLYLRIRTTKNWNDVLIDLDIFNEKDQMVVDTKAKFMSKGINFKVGEEVVIHYKIKHPHLAPGNYLLSLYVKDRDRKVIYWHELIPAITVTATNSFSTPETLFLDDIKGIIIPDYTIDVIDKTIIQ